MQLHSILGNLSKFKLICLNRLEIAIIDVTESKLGTPLLPHLKLHAQVVDIKQFTNLTPLKFAKTLKGIKFLHILYVANHVKHKPIDICQTFVWGFDRLQDMRRVNLLSVKLTTERANLLLLIIKFIHVYRKGLWIEEGVNLRVFLWEL